MDAKSHHIRVVMFPWLAHGHIFPFLELAKKLSKRNFSIYFCSTPINLSSINQNLSNFTSLFPSIQFVELHLPSLPNLPPHSHTTKSLPPHLIPTLTTALDMAQPSFSNILKTLNPDLLIYDFMQPWAPELASSLINIPAIQFLTMGALASCYFYHRCKKIINLVAALDIQFPYLEQHEDQRITQLLESPSNNFENKNRFVHSLDQSQTFVLIRTFGDIEHKYIDNISFLLDKEIIPVGPLVDHDQEPTIINHGKQCSESFMEWLGKKHKGSTVFASFGSEYYLSREEIEEIALGLELSEVNFIWVIRFHDDHDDEIVIKLGELLPQGFLERIKEKGIVVEGWAPQVEILGHCSIGGFLSHCGWSSVMEAMRFGVPIIAMPMQIDQPLNARLVVNELGVGLEAKRDDGKIRREEVAKVIREVVVEKEGEDVRKRMKELSEKMRKQGEEAIDVVAEKLSHLSESKMMMRNSSS